MVFLLLIYFMVTASLIKSEGDLGIKLPGVVEQSVSVDMPDEQIIEIRESGSVILNGKEYDPMPANWTPEAYQKRPPDKDDPVPARALAELTETLMRYNQASKLTKNEAMVTLWAADGAKHQWVVDVMNACAEAGIENVTFTASAAE
jgi:biopolymer transport protein ExbD